MSEIKIETKYKINETVYFINGNKIKTGIISRINIKASISDTFLEKFENYEIWYDVQGIKNNNAPIEQTGISYYLEEKRLYNVKSILLMDAEKD